MDFVHCICRRREKKPLHLGREITRTVLPTVFPALERMSCKVAENWDFVGECFPAVNWSVFGG